MHNVQLASSAVRDLDKICEPDLSRLQSHILSLEHNPRPQGSLKLKDAIHRVRVGDWRILYAIDDKQQTVIILRVLRRSERTYKGI
ncbi:MAG: type II toxin-antitoxin system RelE/ParE family toxin [Elusimicrobiota bacterium]|nr:type II toxin-antitoxin system RelE/ParE family toxin [Elusimicrobiota bacterium]